MEFSLLYINKIQSQRNGGHQECQQTRQAPKTGNDFIYSDNFPELVPREAVQGQWNRTLIIQARKYTRNQGKVSVTTEE